MQQPVPTPIFHITPIVNLRRIAESGVLYSKRELIQRNMAPANISYDHIQARRAVRPVPLPPGGTLHDYVPFHFAPRSPMLDTINRGNVPNCDHRQQDIAHLVLHAQSVAHGGLPFVFTDVHAVLDPPLVNFFNDLAHLDRVHWDLLLEDPRLAGYCKYYFSSHTNPKYATRREARQAEFLIHGTVPVGLIVRISVVDAAAQARVAQQLAGTGWNPVVEVVCGWYF